MSDGESISDNSSTSSGFYEPGPYSSPLGPVIDWNGVVGQPLCSVDQDDISTICFSNPENSDSAYNVKICNPVYHSNSDSDSEHSVVDASEDYSSNGTIEEFCETYLILAQKYPQIAPFWVYL